MVLADLALGGDQTGFRVGVVVLAVVREEDRGTRIGGGLRDSLLRFDVFVPSRGIRAERAGQCAA